MPVVVDNDANFAAHAEALVGAARGYSKVLMVTMGTGIGGGIWIDGDIYRGRGFAGEIGHMRLVPDGAPCACGQRGCWETVCSGRRLDELAGRLAAAEPSGAVATLAGDGTGIGAGTSPRRHCRGIAAALSAVEGVARWLAVGDSKSHCRPRSRSGRRRRGHRRASWRSSSSPAGRRWPSCSRDRSTGRPPRSLPPPSDRMPVSSVPGWRRWRRSPPTERLSPPRGDMVAR